MTRSKRKFHRKSKDENRDEPIEKLGMHNPTFEGYYKAQSIIPDEKDWKDFVDAMQRGLPTTFRVAGCRQTAHTLNSAITDTYVPLLGDAVFEGEKIPPPTRIPWYPEGLAWVFNVSKKVLRKSPEFKKFHSFLVFETEVGNISRQEAVSMLPPLFMDVEPHHVVLDMCAAPGSKTAQLLESLHFTNTPTYTTIPPGLLIANDNDYKRCQLLVHQMARLSSPSLIVTNLDASIYPIISVPADSTHAGVAAGEESKHQKRVKRKIAERGDESVKTRQLLFDRILCDVPCSGDGTIRKNLGIWKSWNGGNGNGLHGLQLRILQRAMKMLKVQGRIVYSTCSLNPVENEAVVAAALKTNPEFELVDESSRLPELIRRPGMKRWTPPVGKDADTSFKTYDAFMDSLPEEKKTMTKMVRSHWPPGAEEVEDFKLERCMRIYPHLQDTGGFFVAVLQRKVIEEIREPIDRKREASTPVGEPDLKKPKLDDVEVDLASSAAAPISYGMEDVVEAGKQPLQKSEAKGKEKGDGAFKESPYAYLSPDDPILQQCRKRLNLNNDFPSSNALVRNPTGDAVRSLYLTNSLIKVILEHNDYTRLRIINAGTKVFTKQEGGRGMEPSFRVLGEGLPVVLPFIDPVTILDGDIAVLKILITTYYPLCAAFGEPFKSAIEAREPGSHVVRFPPGEWDGVTLSHELVLPIWKSNVSLSLMVDKKAKSAMSLRLFGEDITAAAREAATKNNPRAFLPATPPVADGEDGEEVRLDAEPVDEDVIVPTL